MYRIAEKKVLNKEVTLFRVEAPLIAKKAKPGQFIILRVAEGGERIPLTVADTDPEKGLVTIIFQIVGKTTDQLSRLEEGEALLDFVGPLGVASELNGIKKACVIGGGLGVAIAYPQAKALHALGAKVDVISGFRRKDLVILEEEFTAVSDRFFVCTDDGSYGFHGFVSQKLEELLKDPDRPIFAAVEGDKLLGYCFCVIEITKDNPVLMDQKSLYIDDLCVDENTRGRHVGSALYDYAVNYAR